MPLFSPPQQQALETLARDLEEVFAARLQALVAYHGSHGDGTVHSCALVDRLDFRDLVRCLPFTERWHQRRLAVPLMLSADELRRTLDIFPLEYAAIVADHAVIRGRDPFADVHVRVEDLRRGAEAQAKSHLIHLRESYLESRGEASRVAQLIAVSAPPLRALLTNIARLSAGPAGPGDLSDEALGRMAETRMAVPAAVIREVLSASDGGQSSITDPSHLLSRYVGATEKIWEYVDGWTA